MAKPNYTLEQVVLYLHGQRTNTEGLMTTAEMVDVNRVNAIKQNGRVWKLWSVPNVISGM